MTLSIDGKQLEIKSSILTDLPKNIDLDNPEFQQAFKLIRETNQSVFLTGKAGTGKSTFLKYICQNTTKKFVVLAPTGIAAINAGGQTVHSFFKAPFRPLLPNDPDLSTDKGRIFDFLKYRKNHCKLIEELELVIIDEISMLRADLVDFIDRVLRVYSKNMRLPFGGKQVLMVGDVYQLEPVVKRDQWEILRNFYKSSFFFSARVFSEMKLVSIELMKVYRQTDNLFVSILDSIRVNQTSNEYLAALNRQFKPDFKPEEGNFFITLASKRSIVDFKNEKELEALPGKAIMYLGKIEGDFNENSLPNPLELELKEDAQVMFIKNDQERRWVNGTIGKIASLEEDGILVTLENGNDVLVEKDMWRNIRYEYNEKEKKVEEIELGNYVQYPLRLAWAVTIHKSQGLTFDRVIVDLGTGAFAGGQTYVALSRCTSLDGIILKNRITQRDIFVKPEVVSFAKAFNDQQVIQESMQIAQSRELLMLANKEFENGNVRQALEHFSKAQSLQDILADERNRRLISKKLSIIGRLQASLDKLKKQEQERDKEFSDMAREFYLMGNECIVKAKDARSAIANFNKALKINPKFTDAWIRKGITQMDIGHFDEAEDDFSEAIRTNQRSFKAFLNRGKLYAKMKRLDAARADLEKATTLNRKNKSAFRLLGDVCSKLGDMTAAAEAWRMADKLR